MSWSQKPPWSFMLSVAQPWVVRARVGAELRRERARIDHVRLLVQLQARRAGRVARRRSPRRDVASVRPRAVELDDPSVRGALEALGAHARERAVFVAFDVDLGDDAGRAAPVRPKRGRYVHDGHGRRSGVATAEERRRRLDVVRPRSKPRHGVCVPDAGEDVGRAPAARRVPLRQLPQARRVRRVRLEADDADVLSPRLAILAEHPRPHVEEAHPPPGRIEMGLEELARLHADVATEIKIDELARGAVVRIAADDVRRPPRVAAIDGRADRRSRREHEEPHRSYGEERPLDQELRA